MNINPTASIFHLSITHKGIPLALSELISVRGQERGLQNFNDWQDRQWLEEFIKGMRVRRKDLGVRYNAACQEIPDARIVFGLAYPRIRDNQRETCTEFGSLAEDTYCWEEDGVRRSIADKYKGAFFGLL